MRFCIITKNLGKKQTTKRSMLLYFLAIKLKTLLSDELAIPGTHIFIPNCW